LDEIQRIVKQAREKWPQVQVILRGDSGFSREAIMTRRESQERGDYVFGQAKNERLLKLLSSEMEVARRQFEATGLPMRVFGEKRYQTLDSWSCERRLVGKAEHLAAGANPRFVVTSLGQEQYDARALYEDLSCAHGEMENRIKEQQLELFADQTSAKYLKSNQTRLWLSSVAYVLMNGVLATAGLEKGKKSPLALASERRAA
jgi:hypothetical protein